MSEEEEDRLAGERSKGSWEANSDRGLAPPRSGYTAPCLGLGSIFLGEWSFSRIFLECHAGGAARGGFPAAQHKTVSAVIGLEISGGAAAAGR